VRLSGDLDPAVPREDRLQGLREELVVVGDEDGDRLGGYAVLYARNLPC
jgi:hypothetical protein